MIVGVSTGIFHGKIDGINKRIDFFRTCGIPMDGIELSFDCPKKMCASSLISRENRDYLSGLPFNTMHLPWINVRYDGSDRTYLRMLSDVYHDLGLRVAVIHPDCVRDVGVYGYLLDLFPGLAVENLTPDRKFGSTVGDLESVVSSEHRLGVVVDYAHCMAGGDSFADFERSFSSRIREIHMSAYSDCGALSKHVLISSGFDLPAIGLKNVPIVLEGPTDSVDELKKEIDFVRGIFMDA